MINGHFHAEIEMAECREQASGESAGNQSCADINEFSHSNESVLSALGDDPEVMHYTYHSNAKYPLPCHAAFNRLGLISREEEEIAMFGQRGFGVM